MGVSINKSIILIGGNVVTFLLGGVFLGIGIYLRIFKNDYDDISSYDFITPSNIAIVMSVIIMLVSFFGCVNALIEKRVLFVVYVVLILVVIIAELFMATFALTKSGNMRDDFSVDFLKSIKEKYGQPNYKETTKLIDKFQDDFECCGVSSYYDWSESIYVNTTSKIPKSCCLDKFKDTTHCGPVIKPALLHRNMPYKNKGCYKDVLKSLEDDMFKVGSIALAVAATQIILLIIPIMLIMFEPSQTPGK